MTNRMDQIDKLIKQEISKEIQEIFYGSIISVTQVNVSKDLAYAKVWVSGVNIDNLAKKCQENAPMIRQHLAKKLVLRKVPKLHFVEDLTEDKATKIERILENIDKEEE